MSGLLAVAHQKGDVRVYQYSSARQEVSQATLPASGRASFVAASQPAGYQCIAHVTAHQADVTALAMAARCRVLACGDATGQTSIVDLSQVSAEEMSMPCVKPTAQCRLSRASAVVVYYDAPAHTLQRCATLRRAGLRRSMTGGSLTGVQCLYLYSCTTVRCCSAWGCPRTDI